MEDEEVLNGLALCAGVGGIELGLRLALGGGYRAVCYVEREAYAVACLAARMEDGQLDGAPVWDDIASFDGRAWRGTVDIVSAGIPCQPFSCAGKRGGTEDERWIWDEVWRVVCEVEPRYVFLENVPGILVSEVVPAYADGGVPSWLYPAGLWHVLRDLAEGGWAAEWDVFSACASGAPHLRRRVFVVGRHANGGGESDVPVNAAVAELPEYVADAKRAADGPESVGVGGCCDTAVAGDDGSEGVVADAAGARCCGGGCGSGGAARDGARGPGSGGLGADVADACGSGSSEREGERGDAGAEREAAERGGDVANACAGGCDTGQRDVSQGESDAVGRGEDVSDAAGVGGGAFGAEDGESLGAAGVGGGGERGGGGWWSVEPELGRVADGVADRVDRLRALGNAVVPAVAARAWRVLHGRLVGS